MTLPSISSYLPKFDTKGVQETIKKHGVNYGLHATFFAAQVGASAWAANSNPTGYLVAFLAQRCFSQACNAACSLLPERVKKGLPLNDVGRFALNLTELAASFVAGHKIAQLAGYETSLPAMVGGSALLLGAILGVSFGTILGATLRNAVSKDPFKEGETQITDITKENFQKEVNEEKLPVVLDAYATWCPPCRAMAPILSELSEELKGKVKFVKFNVDKEPELTQELGIQAMPTFIVFKEGKKVETHQGALPKDALLTMINKTKET
jgi:thioredoxin 1